MQSIIQYCALEHHAHVHNILGWAGMYLQSRVLEW